MCYSLKNLILLFGIMIEDENESSLLSYLIVSFLFGVFTALIFAHCTRQSCSCFSEFLINNGVDLI